MAGPRIAIVEPFYAGSHRYWVDRLKQHLDAEVTLFTLPGRHWKWRMAAAALPLSEELNKHPEQFDVILTTDMLDVTGFKSYLNPLHIQTPIVLYMHENQVVYPFQTSDKDKNWDRHYGLINYKSMLSADEVWFNSEFHRTSLLDGLKAFLKPFPEANYYLAKLDAIAKKSSVVPLGIDVSEINTAQESKPDKHSILWNHRWEHDKNPEVFFSTLEELSSDGLDFDLIVCGEHFNNAPAVFARARKSLDKHVIHWGYFDSRQDYIMALWKATLLPVTNCQEFFGLSVMEAVYAQVIPVLPRRLSYPELYSDLALYYDTDEQLKAVLSAQLIKPYSFDNEFVVSDFSWENVIRDYQNRLAKYAT
jgi:glycosyltransferase involved in cell wall biosynthesis